MEILFGGRWCQIVAPPLDSWLKKDADFLSSQEECGEQCLVWFLDGLLLNSRGNNLESESGGKVLAVWPQRRPGREMPWAGIQPLCKCLPEPVPRSRGASGGFPGLHLAKQSGVSPDRVVVQERILNPELCGDFWGPNQRGDPVWG